MAASWSLNKRGQVSRKRHASVVIIRSPNYFGETVRSVLFKDLLPGSVCQVAERKDPEAVTPRRRSEESRRAILRAALEIATENGYGQLSIEAIAARAGVGKQTIYRWWPSKGAVVMDAFLAQMKLRLEWTQESDLETELIAQVTRVHSILLDERLGGHVAGLIGEAQRDPAVAEKFRQGVVLPYREVTLQGLSRAQQNHQLRDNTNIAHLADALFAPLWFRLLLQAAPLDEFDPSTHVRQLLTGASSR